MKTKPVSIKKNALLAALGAAAILATFSYSFSAYAFDRVGNSSGGGGKGVVCRNADKSLKSVETLDLWEARELHQELPLASSGDLANDVDAALQNLANSYPRYLYSADDKDRRDISREFFLKEMRSTAQQFLTDNKSVLRKRGTKLEDTEDAMELLRPEDCGIEQIVNYQPVGSPILLNQDLFERMDLNNQAALIAHEAYYELLRRFASETTSIRVRRAIGYVFSGHVFEHVPGKLPEQHPKEPRIVCNAPGVAGAMAGTYIAISPDFSKVDFSSVAGTSLIGNVQVQPVSAAWYGGTPEMLKAMFDKKWLAKQCKDGGPTQTLLWENAGGPVEYGRSLSLTRSCNDKRSMLTLATRAPGETQITEIQLSCKIEK